MSTTDLLLRKDAPAESQWDLDHVFPNWEAWQMEYDAVAEMLPRAQGYAGRLADGPGVVAEWLTFYSEMRRRVQRLRLYPYMQTVVDNANRQAKGALGQVGALMSQARAASAFADPELIALGDTLRTWAEADINLSAYAHYFDDLLRQAPHKRSPEVEEILGRLGDPFGNVFQTYNELTNADLDFGHAQDSQGNAHPIRQSNLRTHLGSPDPVRRRTAWESYADAYLGMQNTLASNYITHVKQTVFLARARGYDSVLAATLHPHGIPEEVFHNLINTFQANLPVWHRYWAAKRKALAADEIRPCDVWAPLHPDSPDVPYTQSVEWIVAALAPLGDEYTGVLRRACLEEGWVDWAPNAEKRQGAQSLRAKNTHPFLWLSYDDSLSAASTLAHELGHSMHSHFSDRHQPELYSDYNMSAAETASNFNQAMLRAYLAGQKGGDDAFMLASIDEAMGNFHRYFFIMPTLARFEYAVYSRAEAGKSLTVDFFNETMASLFAEGYGTTMSDDAVRTAITWAQFLHLYIPYYTFQYSVGISAAHDIAGRILAGEEGAVQGYLAFLSSGSAHYPVDLFRLAGVDLTSPASVERTFGVLADIVARLEGMG